MSLELRRIAFWAVLLCGVWGCRPSDQIAGQRARLCEDDAEPCVICGDAFCNEENGETCSTCSTDCGECDSGPDAGSCGDAFCNEENGETCSTCSTDCGECDSGPDAGSCGDAFCNEENGETCSTCSTDCGECADGGEECEEDGGGAGMCAALIFLNKKEVVDNGDAPEYPGCIQSYYRRDLDLCTGNHFQVTGDACIDDIETDAIRLDNGSPFLREYTTPLNMCLWLGATFAHPTGMRQYDCRVLLDNPAARCFWDTDDNFCPAPGNDLYGRRSAKCLVPAP